MIERYTRLQALLSDYADTLLALDLKSAIAAALEDSYERGYMHGFHDNAWRPEQQPLWEPTKHTILDSTGPTVTS